MNADLRTYTAIALLMMCGCALAEPVEPVSADRNGKSAVPLAKPDASGSRSATDLAKRAGYAATASAEDAAPAAGERRAESGRRLTLREKRIFVLGLAAQEKK